MSEFAELNDALKCELPDLKIFQLKKFVIESFEKSVWNFWLNGNENVYLHIEVNSGMLWAIYANKEFGNKYPINAGKICEIFKGIKENSST